MTVHRLYAFELHFKVVDLVTGLHVLEHVAGQGAFQVVDFLFDGRFLFSCHFQMDLSGYSIQYKKVLYFL